MTLAQRTSGQIEGWIIKRYFDGTLPEDLKDYARYWIKRLGINENNYYLFIE